MNSRSRDTGLTFAGGFAALAGIILLAQAVDHIQDVDTQVAERTQQRYCEGVAIWHAEESRGVAIDRRAGYPDHLGIADERCPGASQAALVQHTPTGQRQLVQF